MFQQYATFYDAFYADKDYQAECEYFQQMVERYLPMSHLKLLDVGCGTGRHAEIFAKHWRVWGIDTSDEMIKIAKHRATNRLNFEHIDLQNAQFTEQFDVVTALFAVLCYVTETEQLNAFFAKVAELLKIGGLLILDVWHEEGVLAQKPENRQKIVEHDGIKLIRKATSRHILDEKVVEVQYNFSIKRVAEMSETFEETHLLRYFSVQELQKFAAKSGLELLVAEGLMKPYQTPSSNDWNMVLVLKKS